ncbi:hypothetical protein DL768_001136 [Monosporascus sp. mg162]|nr:hypothetical protein DL768_001136 [Monosporascus sp. mg162]
MRPLLLDDVEDGSHSRRGKPATHTIFRLSQIANSAGYEITEALKETRKLDDARCIDIVIDLSDMYTGQGHDLLSAFNAVCPSIEQYIRMVDSNGGAFPRAREAYGSRVSSAASERLSRYSEHKGFCKDPVEGKFSLTMTHAMQ